MNNIAEIFTVEHVVVAAILFVCMLFYFKMAAYFRIIDKPNERSSHITPTIRGGGIIFPIAILMFAFFNSFAFPYLISAVLLSALVSFIDDIKDTPRLIRFGVHLLASILVLYQAGILNVPVVLAGLALFLVVGMINAFNFMDGINGITGFYSLAVMLPLMFTEVDIILLKLEVIMLIALIVFLYFNARKKARCFAGDVGSVTVAVIMCFLVVQRIIATNDYTYLGFFSVYLVDTGLTIIQRAKAGERIFDAHRKHLFQVMSNEMNMPHLLVSVIFASMQLLINVGLITVNTGIPGLIVLFLLLIITYIIIKVRLLKVA